MRRSLSILALAALATGLATAPARAQFNVTPGTAEIQEDWKLIVANGDPARDGPQIMTYMSPYNTATGQYAWFLINVRDNPNPYTPGGLEVQIWDYSDNLIASSTSTQATAKLNTANETITWTSRMAMSTKNNQSTFEILNGNSTTWGAFGSSSGLAAITLSGTSSLSNYDPHVSASKSRVGWQANNVTSLTLVTVRQYGADGKLIRTDTMNLAVNLTPQ